MSNKNVFQELQDEKEEEFEEVRAQLKRNVVDRKSYWTLFGDIIQLYVPQVFSTVGRTINASSSLLGNNEDQSQTKSLN